MFSKQNISDKQLTISDLPTEADMYNAEKILLPIEKSFEVADCGECGNKGFIGYMDKRNIFCVYPCKCRGEIVKKSLINSAKNQS